jgi:hypothetical protein
VAVIASFIAVRSISIVFGLACLTALVTASCTTRYAASSMSGSRRRPFPRLRKAIVMSVLTLALLGHALQGAGQSDIGELVGAKMLDDPTQLAHRVGDLTSKPLASSRAASSCGADSICSRPSAIPLSA